MSNESKETIADIVRMIRKSQNGNVHTISAKEAYALADRIEAAAMREREAGAEGVEQLARNRLQIVTNWATRRRCARRWSRRRGFCIVQ